MSDPDMIEARQTISTLQRALDVANARNRELEGVAAKVNERLVQTIAEYDAVAADLERERYLRDVDDEQPSQNGAGAFLPSVKLP